MNWCWVSLSAAVGRVPVKARPTEMNRPQER